MQRLDAILVVVVELEPVRAEELDAVVGERVVRGRDDGAEVAPCSRTSQAMPGRRQHAGAQRDAAGGRDAGAQRVLEHRSRAARVAPDDDERAVLRAPRSRANSADGAPERERELGPSSVAVGDATDAVRAEQAPATGGFSASRTAGGAVRP